MTTLTQAAGVLALGIACSLAGTAQEQPSYNRVVCVKVREGKGTEYAAYLREVAMKLAKASVEGGIYSAVIFSQAVFPAGRSARCDYQFVYITNGFPPEPNPGSPTEADMKNAGITIGREAMLGKRNELSYLVGTDLWRGQGAVGNMIAKGAYARLNYYKIKPRMQAEWIRMETTGWKPLAESVAKEMGTSWSIWTLAMPGGDSLPYNALSVDGYPTWEGLGKGIPMQATWSKVHPDMDSAQYFDKLYTVAERPRTDVVRIMDVIRK